MDKGKISIALMRLLLNDLKNANAINDTLYNLASERITKDAERSNDHGNVAA